MVFSVHFASGGDVLEIALAAPKKLVPAVTMDGGGKQKGRRCLKLQKAYHQGARESGQRQTDTPGRMGAPQPSASGCAENPKTQQQTSQRSTNPRPL